MNMVHPKKKLKVKKIYQFQPDFPILHMTLTSIKSDQKQKKIDPKNKNLLSKFYDIGQMEFLELYESCVQFDETEKIRKEQEDLKDDQIMKTKIDF